MKVSELTGALLDYWVACAEGHTVDPDGDLLDVRTNGGAPMPYHPSTDWTQGGPLIEKWVYQLIECENGKWGADPKIDSPGMYAMVEGDAPLQAICRAVVRAAFGEEIPDTTLALPKN